MPQPESSPSLFLYKPHLFHKITIRYFSPRVKQELLPRRSTEVVEPEMIPRLCPEAAGNSAASTEGGGHDDAAGCIPGVSSRLPADAPAAQESAQIGSGR